MKLLPPDWQIVKKILQDYPYQFYIFGSRSKGTAKKFSDLDLCYKENIPPATISEIRERFEESNLPFTVDILDWNSLSNEFKQHIAADLQPLQLTED